MRAFGTGDINAIRSPDLASRRGVMDPVADGVVPRHIQERGIVDRLARWRTGAIPIRIRKVADRSPVDPHIGLVIVRGADLDLGRCTSGIDPLSGTQKKDDEEQPGHAEGAKGTPRL